MLPDRWWTELTIRTDAVESPSRTSAQIAGRGDHGRNLGGRNLARVHRPAREGAEPAVWIQEHAFGGIETEGLFDGAPNLRRRLDLLRPGIDDAEAELLALERHERRRRDRWRIPARAA